MINTTKYRTVKGGEGRSFENKSWRARPQGHSLKDQVHYSQVLSMLPVYLLLVLFLNEFIDVEMARSTVHKTRSRYAVYETDSAINAIRPSLHVLNARYEINSVHFPLLRNCTECLTTLILMMITIIITIIS
jgi:hypothetical protein